MSSRVSASQSESEEDSEVTAALAAILAHCLGNSSKLAQLEKAVLDLHTDVLGVKADMKDLLQLQKKPSSVFGAASPLAASPRPDPR